MCVNCVYFEACTLCGMYIRAIVVHYHTHCGCIADNQIRDAGAKDLADALKINKTLHTLNLSSTFVESMVVMFECGQHSLHRIALHLTQPCWCVSVLVSLHVG